MRDMQKRAGFHFNTLLLGAALAVLAACIPAAEVTHIVAPTDTIMVVAQTPTAIPTPIETQVPTATPDLLATQQAEFETKKAEVLMMVSIKLETLEDFRTLPVLDDVADFDSGKVQEAEYFLINNVLPPTETKLPDSWSINCNDANGYCWLDYNRITDKDVKLYRLVDAFFVIRDGKKMLRIGLEFGGKDQLIHINFEDPRWWTDFKRMNGLIADINRNGLEFLLIDNYGSETFSSIELYNRKVTTERIAAGDQMMKYWVKNHMLPDGADKTVFGITSTSLLK